jgi:hypothetical protein
MRFLKVLTGMALASALAVASLPAAAMPFDGLGAATGGPAAAIQDVQYVYGGHNYCFYPAGWRGPGWYWCGYAFRRGFGWGGGAGWHGWRGGGGGFRGGPGFRGGFHGGRGGGFHGGGHGGGGHGGHR